MISVLVVDDHKAIRQGLRDLVGSYGDCTVAGEAEDGARACELAQQLGPDVILMDINMPRMNGIEATRWIKTKLPHIIIIGLSVNLNVESAHQMQEAGAAAYLAKDTAPEDLHRAIHTARIPQV